MNLKDPTRRLFERSAQGLGLYGSWAAARRALGLGSLVVVAVLGCSKAVEEPAPILRPVRYQAAAAASGARTLSLAGAARASVESQLSFRVSGSVADVRVKVGDLVKRGQLLARLDPADFELQVEEAEASIAQSVAATRRAEADYARARALYENNNVAKSDLDAARAEAESAKAQEAAGRKRLEQAQKQLDYTWLRAPTEGAVALVGLEVNENVQAGQAAVLLTSGSNMEVRIAVPEQAIAALESGQSATVRFDSLPNVELAGRVTEVGVAATSSSTFEVIVELLDPNPGVRSGMAAEVSLSLQGPAQDSAVVLPPVAIGEDRSGRFVFVVESTSEGEGVVKRRAVTVGQFTDSGVEVTSGLTAGELVATAGVRRLSDGMEVRLVGESETL